jgi:hypothetical protein
MMPMRSIGFAVVVTFALAFGEISPAAHAQTVAAGYVLEQNCPNLSATFINNVIDSYLTTPQAASWNIGQVAFSRDGTKLYLTYAPGARSPGQVHVRDIATCTQKALITNIEGPLGIAVHPRTGNLYITHRYVNPSWVDGTSPAYQKIRSAISIYNPTTGALLVDKWVKGFAPSIPFGVPANGDVGNGLQGLTFDRAGNLYAVPNLDVWETDSQPAGCAATSSCDFWATGPLYKITPQGRVSEFATGFRASFEAVIAKTNLYGEATAFYAGDNGEGLFCGGNGCNDRSVPGATPPRSLTRQYYDELNYVLPGGHYGYPESASTVAFDQANTPLGEEGAYKSHLGPLWNFERANGIGFTGTPTAVWPVPTGVALVQGDWGHVKDPLFMTFWLGARLDMFTGLNRSERTTLVNNLPGRGTDVLVCPASGEVWFVEDSTRVVWKIRPAY